MRKPILAVFPYRTDPSGNTFPIISVALESGRIKKEFLALVDSGASTSIFRGEVADVLGIRIESGKVVYLNGVGGKIKGYLHKLMLEIAGKSFWCIVVFSRDYLVSFNLLGRENFFKKFIITFEEKYNRLVLK